LLFLRSGAVEVVKEGVRIANLSAPGSVFGEQATLLDQPHTADVWTVRSTRSWVAKIEALGGVVFSECPMLAADCHVSYPLLTPI
jgi:CRP/FNR family transcriptional regulator, cyclic AMP receptor protein